MSKMLAQGVLDRAQQYQARYTRARAVGVTSGTFEYTSGVQTIVWGNISTGTTGSPPRDTANFTLSTADPLEWGNIPEGVTIDKIWIYRQEDTDTPIAEYILDEPKAFQLAGTLRVTTLPTIIDSGT